MMPLPGQPNFPQPGAPMQPAPQMGPAPGLGPPPMQPPMAPPGGGLVDLIGMMAQGMKRETSQDKIKRAMKILDAVRDEDPKVEPIISTALDYLRNGPDLPDGQYEKEGGKSTDFRPSLFKAD